MVKTSYLTVKLGTLFRTDFINILLVGMAQQYEDQKSPGVVGLEVPWEKFHIEHQIRLVRIQLLNDRRDVKHSHRSQVVREVRCCFPNSDFLHFPWERNTEGRSQRCFFESYRVNYHRPSTGGMPSLVTPGSMSKHQGKRSFCRVVALTSARTGVKF